MSLSYQGGTPVVSFRPSGDQDWAKQSECAKPGSPLMFPHEADVAGVQMAKATCHRCPVRLFCLEEALDRNERFGVWGGLDSSERHTMRKQTARKAAAKRKLEAIEAKADAVLDELAARASGLTVEEA